MLGFCISQLRQCKLCVACCVLRCVVVVMEYSSCVTNTD
jgi:hypothetical protein